MCWARSYVLASFAVTSFKPFFVSLPWGLVGPARTAWAAYCCGGWICNASLWSLRNTEKTSVPAFRQMILIENQYTDYRNHRLGPLLDVCVRQNIARQIVRPKHDYYVKPETYLRAQSYIDQRKCWACCQKINTGNEQPSCVNPNDMLMNMMNMHRPFAAESKIWPSGQSRPLNFRAKRSWR